MSVTAYSSLDASSPILTGETGKLNDLLSAILVDGYGSKSAAGWTKPYTDATSKTAVFRPAAGPQHYFQIQDNGPGLGTFKEARIRGYVAMSAYNTGTEPFPTVAQAANGHFIRKSQTADTVARAWRAVADNKSLYVGILTGDAANTYFWYFFGAFRSWKTSDAYASQLAARFVENSFTDNQGATAFYSAQNNFTTLNNAYAPRSYTALGAAVQMGHSFNATLANASTQNPMGSIGLTYPNPVDGGILLSPMYTHESGFARGTMPGMWVPAHTRPILHDDTFTAVDGAVTRTFIACNISSNGQFMLETSDTWYND